MFLFVYGTLRRGFNSDKAERLAAESEWIGTAVMPNACLYRVRWEFDYPALVLVSSPNEEQSVTGDLVRLFSTQTTMAWLDEYEWVGPGFEEPNEYTHKQVQIRLMGGQSDGDTVFTATTYVWNRPVRNEQGQFCAPIIGQIESGDWMEESKQREKGINYINSNVIN